MILLAAGSAFSQTRLDTLMDAAIEFAKIQLNNLGYEETLYLMYMLIPETQKHSIEFNRLDKKKETLIPSLFLKGCISSATAARWLGLSEKAFLDSISSSKSR